MSSSGYKATKLSDSIDLLLISLHFKLALNPLLLIHNVVRSLFNQNEVRSTIIPFLMTI